MLQRGFTRSRCSREAGPATMAAHDRRKWLHYSDL